VSGFFDRFEFSECNPLFSPHAADPPITSKAAWSQATQYKPLLIVSDLEWKGIPVFAIRLSSPGYPTASDPDHLKRFSIRKSMIFGKCIELRRNLWVQEPIFLSL